MGKELVTPPQVGCRAQSGLAIVRSFVQLYTIIIIILLFNILLLLLCFPLLHFYLHVSRCAFYLTAEVLLKLNHIPEL